MPHPTTSVGLVLIYGVILLPVYVMFTGWLFGKPRRYRTVALAFGYLIGLITMILAGLFVLDTVITIIVTIT